MDQPLERRYIVVEGPSCDCVASEPCTLDELKAFIASMDTEGKYFNNWQIFELVESKLKIAPPSRARLIIPD